MSGEVRGKLPMVLLSLLASVVLFFYVRSQEAPSTVPGIYSLDIELRNVPAGLDAKVQPSKITWQAIGPAETVVNIDRDRLHAFIDLAEATEGERKYTVKIETPSYSNVEWRALRPSASVILERLTSREIQVSVEAVGQLGQDNVIYSDATTDPKSVILEGPKSAVDSVMRAEVLLDLSKASESMGFQSLVLPKDKDGNRVPGVTVDPERVMVLPVIASAPQAKLVFVNANYQGQPAFGYGVKRIEVVPARVRVSGKSEQVAGFNVLETEPIDLQGIRQTQTFSAKLKLPSGVRATPEFVEVRVVIVPVEVPSLLGDPGANPSSPPLEDPPPR